MTVPPQPVGENPQQQQDQRVTIVELVKAKVDALKITRAIILDDAIEPEITQGNWTAFVDLIQNSDASLWQTVQSIVGDSGGDIEVLPDDQSLDKIQRLVDASGNAEAIKLIIPTADASLTSLMDYLKEVNIEVSSYAKLDESVPKTEKLYFLDYRLRPEQPQTAGEDASRLLADIVKDLPEGAEPPAAMLMSRSINDRPTEHEWERVVRDGGGFVRSNFRYLEKGTLSSREKFLFLLYDLLLSVPLGRAYFDHVRALRGSAKSTVDRVAAEICGLLPSDFAPFASRLFGNDQQAKAGDHLLGLFSGLLANELRNDTTVRDNIQKFFQMLVQEKMPAPNEVRSHSLHRLHAKLLYDQSDYILKSPIGFGDIYQLRGKSGFYIIITPECDVEPRSENGVCGPKVERILLIHGELKDQKPPKDVGNIEATPLMLKEGSDEIKWIHWNLQNARILPWRRLQHQSGRWKKWARLRVQEAEKIQLRYAADVLAVGTDDVSSHLRSRAARLYKYLGTKSDFKVICDLEIMEIENPEQKDNPAWALSASSAHILCGAEEHIMNADLVTALRCYMPKKEFSEQLKTAKVLVATSGNLIQLGWFSTHKLPNNFNLPASVDAAYNASLQAPADEKEPQKYESTNAAQDHA